MLRQYLKNLNLDYSKMSTSERKEYENTLAFKMLLQSEVTWEFGQTVKKEIFKPSTIIGLCIILGMLILVAWILYALWIVNLF